jgi:sulfatase maturation enzyme AslB (radical SAM superfamily)
VEGNIKERNLKEIWNNPGSFSYNRNFKMEDAGENCAGCGYLSSCRGGCSEMSWMKTGKLHNDLYCFYRIEEELMKEENIFAKFFYKLSKIKRSVKNKSDFSILKKIFLGERK